MESSQAASSSSAGFPESPNKDINRRVAAASVTAALALFLSTRLDFGISLKDLTAAALPYEEVFSILDSSSVCFDLIESMLINDWCEWIRLLGFVEWEADSGRVLCRLV